MIEPDAAAFAGYDARTYGDGFADVYDDWYGDVSDIDATVAAVADLSAGRSVLELGVGTGRLAIPLAATGTSVVGVDASAAMLARLAAKPGAGDIVAVEADMAALDHDPVLVTAAPFGVAFAAFNTFFNLTSDQAQMACLRGVAALLDAAGILIIEGFVPPPGGLSDGGVSVREITADAAILTVSKHDAEAQLIRGHHVELRANGNRLRPWMLHYLTPEQLDDLAARAGFRRLDRWADWDRTPYAAHDTHVSLYERARS